MMPPAGFEPTTSRFVYEVTLILTSETEDEGFEPPHAGAPNGLANRPLQPLG